MNWSYQQDSNKSRLVAGRQQPCNRIMCTLCSAGLHMQASRFKITATRPMAYGTMILVLMQSPTDSESACFQAGFLDLTFCARFVAQLNTLMCGWADFSVQRACVSERQREYVGVRLCLSVCLFVCLSVCLTLCLSVCLSFCLASVRLSVILSVCLLACLPVCLLTMRFLLVLLLVVCLVLLPVSVCARRCITWPATASGCSFQI